MSTVTGTTSPAGGLDVERLRADFPALQQEVHGRPLVYLDNAATTQKPRAVLEAMDHYYRHDNANVHRGVHALSQRATAAYEGARDSIRRFIGADDSHQVIFVRGATEALNLVAASYGRTTLSRGDEIILTQMEHHSNIVPWQFVAEATGAVIRVVPVNDRGELLMEEYRRLLTGRTRIVSVVHVSNALGTVNPIRQIADLAHEAGAIVVVDGAQAAPHFGVDVAALGCDFYALSGHKMYGPTGVGALWGRRELLESMPPYQGGGDMIKSVTFQETTYNDLPYRFEAGTPNIAGVVGLAAAAEYLQGLDGEAVGAWERRLLERATAALQELPQVRLVGTAADKSPVLSFVIDGIHPHDIGTVLDDLGVAIRTGHHCTQPLMERFGIPATARASFGLYNTLEEVDALARGLRRVMEVLG